MNNSRPVVASGMIPVSPNDVSNIPEIAYSIPDFEGQAILRVFDNLTQTEIGCYSAIVTNGASFSQPAAVGTVLGIFTLITLVASVATAMYGEAVSTMRLHYAHSLSTGVVFAVWQHIFFSGALSVNWPSVLPAFWSNFAWAGGMIYNTNMQNSINSFIGNNKGNTVSVGAAASGASSPTLGGGYDITKIYKRHQLRKMIERSLSARATSDDQAGNGFYGHAVGEGSPLPGNYSGFAGTLAEENIPASNAFTTGLIWFVILLVILVGAVVLLKWTIEGLIRVKWLNKDRFKLFRAHWLTFVAATALRVCYLAFFMIMFLTIFQLTYDSSSGVKGLAGAMFAIFILGVPATAIYAFIYKRRRDRLSDHAQAAPSETRGPESQAVAADQATAVGNEKFSFKHFWQRRTASATRVAPRPAVATHNIHDDNDFTIRFGWLTARFRRTRWWFFAFWLFYEFLRAVFYGGASTYALAQVFALLVVEILAFAFIVWARPFEGQRLNVLVVYCLGFSKIVTVALSATFDVRFNLGRIITTAIGIVIIVVQGILTIITLIAIIVGAISSYMSVSRNREDFRPRKLAGIRERYFDHLDRRANDLPREPKPKKVKTPKPAPEEEKEPYFAVTTMRRMNKIEDDDTEFVSEVRHHGSTSQVNVTPAPDASVGAGFRADHTSAEETPVYGRSRAASTQSQSNLPYGARPHRPSWSKQDFAEYDHTVSAHPTNTDQTSFRSPVVEVTSDPMVAKPKKHRRTWSRGSAPQTVDKTPIIAPEELQVGGDASSQRMIGLVPEPKVRPRAGTAESISSSRRISNHHEYQNADMGSSNAPRVPLTPAQELEEFALTPKPQQ